MDAGCIKKEEWKKKPPIEVENVDVYRLPGKKLYIRYSGSPVCYSDNNKNIVVVGMITDNEDENYCLDNNIIHVIYSKQFENSSTEKMVSHTWNLIREFKLNDGISKVFIDASQPGFIRSILSTLGEYTGYEVWVEKSKRENIPLHMLMKTVVPVSFTGEKHKQMLGNCRKLLDKGVVAIDPGIHKDLIQELRLASADESMSLDKKEFSFDILDSFRLALECVKY